MVSRFWEASKWANPCRLYDFDDSRVAVLAAYEKHVRASPELLDAPHELEGKRLGCWCIEKRRLTCGKTRGVAACQHLDCHGDVLVKLLAERREKTGTAVPRRSTGPRPPVPPADDAPAKSGIILDDDPIWIELGLAD